MGTATVNSDGEGRTKGISGWREKSSAREKLLYSTNHLLHFFVNLTNIYCSMKES